MSAIFIIGPAGSGKTSLATALAERCLINQRSVQILNLDAAATNLPYVPSDDIRSVVTLKDLMDSQNLGPNGGLIKCIERYSRSTHLQNLVTDSSDAFVFVDCPGQIEVYMQSEAFKGIVHSFVDNGWKCAVVYALDASFVQEHDKYISGCLNSLIAMVSLELPQINVLSKVDLVSTPGSYERDLETFLAPEFESDNGENNSLTDHLTRVLAECSMTEFYPVSVNVVDTLTNLMSLINRAVDYEDEALQSWVNEEDECI